MIEKRQTRLITSSRVMYKWTVRISEQAPSYAQMQLQISNITNLLSCGNKGKSFSFVKEREMVFCLFRIHFNMLHSF